MALRKKRCDCCGEPFANGAIRMKLVSCTEYKHGSFSARGFARFYCPECMDEIQSEIYKAEEAIRFEKAVMN